MPRGDRMQKFCKDATEMIGETPLVYLNKVTKGLSSRIGRRSNSHTFPAYQNPKMTRSPEIPYGFSGKILTKLVVPD